MENLPLNYQEAQFLVAILESDRQTALRLLAADHFYQPSLLPKLIKVRQVLKRKQAEQRPLE